MSQIRYNARSHVGLKRRVNEDAVLALPAEQIFLVADGMGGHEAGDYASRLIADMVAALPPGLPPAERMQALRDTIRQAHDLIRAEAAARGGVTIGATVACLMLANGHFAAFWAGDSRIYRLGRHPEAPVGIEMLTTDHSVVAPLVTSGQITWDEAEQLPQSNQITRAVGVGEVLELDKLRGEIRQGDRFLICSDGLTKYATFATLERVLRQAPLETAADQLVQIALDGGGADNITVLVIDVL